MSTTCTCGRPTRDDAYVCDTCLDNLSRDLGDIPWLATELDTTLTGERSPVAQDGGRSAKCSCKDEDDKCSHGLVPFNVAASDASRNLKHELVMLVRFCLEEGVRSRGGDDMPADDLVSLSRWLMWRTDGLAFVDMAPEFVRSVRAAVTTCRRVVDLPPERSYAGPCPECKRDLYHRPDAAEVKCSECGTTWDVGEVVAWMRDRITEHMADRLVTAREGSTLLSRYGIEVGQGTIDKWHNRGLIVHAGHEQRAGKDGPRLYRWDELLTLAARNVRMGA